MSVVLQGFAIRNSGIRAYCCACDTPREGCYTIEKLYQPSKGAEFICPDCLPFAQEAIAAYPCALYHAYYPYTKDLGDQPLYLERTKKDTIIKRPLGFEKWACGKCSLVFTSRIAKMRHIDEKHRL